MAQGCEILCNLRVRQVAALIMKGSASDVCRVNERYSGQNELRT
jgi:hypothetical protein